MELEDLCSPILQDIICTDSYETAFGDCDYVLLVGSPPRAKGMERGDLLRQSGELFKNEGHFIGEVARETCKVVVVGNPANTNCLIAAGNSRRVPPSNFSALMRLDENRAKYQLARSVNSHPGDVENLVIWGNHSPLMYPDISNALVGDKMVRDMLDPQWSADEFIQAVQLRGKAVIDTKGSSSVASAASACIDQVRDWVYGTNGAVVSMAVSGRGNPYGIDDSLFFSYPVTCEEGEWKMVRGYETDSFKEHLEKNEAELKKERDEINHLLKYKL